MTGYRMLLLLPAVILFLSHSGFCQAGRNGPTGTIIVSDPKLRSVVSKHAGVTTIAEGFEWSEGPLWIEKEKMLLFSDVPENRIYKWTPAEGKSVYLSPSGYTGDKARVGESGSNGLLLNSKGQLVLCQHGDRRMAVMNAPLNNPKPEFITLADNYNGKRLDSPNDAVYRSNGDLYFTDPPYGLIKNVNDSSKAAPYQGVYKVTAGGKVVLLTDSITRPNGIAFLPGEKTILIANSDPKKPYWYAYDLDADGLFVNGRIFYDGTRESKSARGAPDGLKVDRRGNVFATGPGGILIFDKKGKLLGRIRLPVLASNCGFADNEKTLYITADMYVLKVKLR